MKPLIIILSIHIFSVQTKLLYLLNGGVDFSYLNITEQTILAMVFSLSYSIATAIIIYKAPTKRMVILYAILDGLAVLLYYFTIIPLWTGSIYFAIYTFCIIASTIALNPTEGTGKFSQRKLASILGVSESSLSRGIKKAGE